MKAVVSRFTGAFVRAILVVAVIATPSALLPGVSGDTKQLAALFALFAGLLTFVEYNADAPSLIEFRDAPPFNRVRLIMLFATVFGLTMIEAGRREPSALTEFLHAIGRLIGSAMDFSYSPIRLVQLVFTADVTPAQLEAVRDAAGLSYFIALVSLSIFVIMIKVGLWPLRDRVFNVWVNLPTFDPTSGADVVKRLERDARLNICLGFLLPFIIPFVISLVSDGLDPVAFTAPQTLIWTMTIWAFLPAGLFMRGIAMGRIAEMIRDIRLARDVQDSDQMARASRAF